MIVDQGRRTKDPSGTNAEGLPKRINIVKSFFTARVSTCQSLLLNRSLTSKLAGRDVNVPRAEAYVCKATLYITLY